MLSQRRTARAIGCVPRDPDADMCPGANMLPVSTEECMAHQGHVPLVDDPTVARALVCNRSNVYDQTMETIMGKKQSDKRPIRKAR